jgi:hypothetical protein
MELKKESGMMGLSRPRHVSLNKKEQTSGGSRRLDKPERYTKVP